MNHLIFNNFFLHCFKIYKITNMHTTLPRAFQQCQNMVPSKVELGVSQFGKVTNQSHPKQTRILLDSYHTYDG
jgi:hypothetical protein